MSTTQTPATDVTSSSYHAQTPEIQAILCFGALMELRAVMSSGGLNRETVRIRVIEWLDAPESAILHEEGSPMRRYRDELREVLTAAGWMPGSPEPTRT